MEIYTVTAVQKIQPSNLHRFADIGDHRCVGFFKNKNEAENAVLNNDNNIHDNIYEYAIVEQMSSGIKTRDISRSVYHWNGKAYEKIMVPSLLKYMSNFGIG